MEISPDESKPWNKPAFWIIFRPIVSDLFSDLFVKGLFWLTVTFYQPAPPLHAGALSRETQGCTPSCLAKHYGVGSGRGCGSGGWAKADQPLEKKYFSVMNPAAEHSGHHLGNGISTAPPGSSQQEVILGHHCSRRLAANSSSPLTFQYQIRTFRFSRGSVNNLATIRVLSRDISIFYH